MKPTKVAPQCYYSFSSKSQALRLKNWAGKLLLGAKKLLLKLIFVNSLLRDLLRPKLTLIEREPPLSGWTLPAPSALVHRAAMGSTEQI